MLSQCFCFAHVSKTILVPFIRCLLLIFSFPIKYSWLTIHINNYCFGSLLAMIMIFCWWRRKYEYFEENLREHQVASIEAFRRISSYLVITLKANGWGFIRLFETTNPDKFDTSFGENGNIVDILDNHSGCNTSVFDILWADLELLFCIDYRCYNRCNGRC